MTRRHSDQPLQTHTHTNCSRTESTLAGTRRVGSSLPHSQIQSVPVLTVRWAALTTVRPSAPPWDPYIALQT